MAAVSCWLPGDAVLGPAGTELYLSASLDRDAARGWTVRVDHRLASVTLGFRASWKHAAERRIA